MNWKGALSSMEIKGRIFCGVRFSLLMSCVVEENWVLFFGSKTCKQDGYGEKKGDGDGDYQGKGS